jgi:hypothetical protein
MTHEKKIQAQYYREFMTSMLLYAVVLICALKFGPSMPDGAGKTAVMLSPMIPILLFVWAVVRHFARIDEYARLQLLQNIAIAYAVTAAVSFTYGFLENVGFPRLTMFVVWPFMCGAYGLVAIARAVCKR